MTEKSNKKITKGRAANQSQNSSRKKDNGVRGNKVSEQLKAAKELQKTEAKKARPEHVVNLIADALWLMGLAATLYLTISLISFDMGGSVLVAQFAGCGRCRQLGRFVRSIHCRCRLLSFRLVVLVVDSCCLRDVV